MYRSSCMSQRIVCPALHPYIANMTVPIKPGPAALQRSLMKGQLNLQLSSPIES